MTIAHAVDQVAAGAVVHLVEVAMAVVALNEAAAVRAVAPKAALLANMIEVATKS